MAYDTVTRSFRQGELKITDGAPATVTVTADEGDLSWTETRDVKEVIYRGDPTAGSSHPMAGNTVPSDVTFTLRCTEFLGSTGANAAPYRILTNQDTNHTSVGSDGEAYMTQLDFYIEDPGSVGTGEKITFTKFYPTSISFTDGDDYSTIAVTGRNFVGPPTIATY